MNFGKNRKKKLDEKFYFSVFTKVYSVFTVAINELLCMKNAGVQIAMDLRPSSPPKP